MAIFFLILTLKAIISLFSPIAPKKSSSLKRIDSIHLHFKINKYIATSQELGAKKEVGTKTCICNTAVMFRPF